MTDLEKVRAELRSLRRGDLLKIAERATLLLPRAELEGLLGDFMKLDVNVERESPQVPLIEDVQKFYRESLEGRYLDEIEAKAKHRLEHSRGTDAFMAELDRLLRQCVHLSTLGPSTSACEAFELLFRLLRYIDEGHDDVVFYSDEPGSWQLGIDWPMVLPAYFRCLAESVSATDFASTVDAVIRAFAEHERPRYMNAAHQAVNTAQNALSDRHG